MNMINFVINMFRFQRLESNRRRQLVSDLVPSYLVERLTDRNGYGVTVDVHGGSQLFKC